MDSTQFLSKCQQYFIELEQRIQKCIWNQKRCWIATAILRKKNEVGGTILPNIRLHYEAIGIQTPWPWRKNRHVDQRNRPGRPEINPHLYGQLIFDKGGRNILYNGVKRAYLIDGVHCVSVNTMESPHLEPNVSWSHPQPEPIIHVARCLCSLMKTGQYGGHSQLSFSVLKRKRWPRAFCYGLNCVPPQETGSSPGLQDLRMWPYLDIGSLQR